MPHPFLPNPDGRTASSDASREALELHRSTLIVNGLDPSRLCVEYLEMLKSGGVNCWVGGVGGISGFASALKFFESNSNKVVLAKSVREIRAAHAQGKIAYVVPWQDAGVLQAEGSPYEPAIENLRTYHELGLRSCGIAYNLSNVFGSGCLEPTRGLTRAGRRLVERIHELRIILDVGGHTGEQTSLDALAISSGVPVVCTHTNVLTLTDNPRCTSDRVLEAIAKTGGVIGVCAFNDFHARTRSDAHVQLTPQVALEKHLDQYDYLKRLVGVDHIGLGPDFVEFRGLVSPLTHAEQELMSPEAYSPHRPWLYVKGFEKISELPNVTEGLLKRGWSTDEVRKVLGENWLRVYEQVWGE